MESIYQNIIMKTNRLKKLWCLLSIIVLLCTVSGCGTGNAGEEIVTKPEETVQEDTFGEESQNPEQEENADTEEPEEEPVQEEAEENESDRPITMADLMAGAGTGAGEAEELSDTILWFNATYAPLTYSNAGNWRLVGGVRPTEDNKELVQYLLYRDWNISMGDSDAAMETVDRLKKDGHREKCRECMEELAEMDMLELDEEEFLEKLLDSGIEENVFRYVIAYYMYQEGLDSDYIAAWDLCRVNQLYADFYICGYMTYEEAMDASLENSLVLRQMYSSWEDMVEAYMVGYQFWQNDPCLTDDSPTIERYSCYEALQEMKDGPYMLDWNMKFQKSW